MAIPILGDLWGKIVDVGGGIISELVTDKDLAKELEHAFRTQMEANSAAFKQAELEAETRIFEAQAVTVQAELHQSDLYTKRTRPKIARHSWYITALYAIAGAFLPILPEAWGIQAPDLDPTIFMVLASPALTYMGVREIGKWKNGK